MADYVGLVNKLKENKLTIGSVESFTGGLFSSLITGVPGASRVYLGSLVTYDPKVKVALAEVQEETIEKHGVVSAEVASEMAKNGRKILGTDICVSFTGDAGPTTEPGNDKVGETFVAIATPSETVVLHKRFIGERNAIRRAACDLAADFVNNSLNLH